MNNALKQFEKQQFLNIETFRKNRQGVKTPVWFAQDGDRLHTLDRNLLWQSKANPQGWQRAHRTIDSLGRNASWRMGQRPRYSS